MNESEMRTRLNKVQEYLRFDSDNFLLLSEASDLSLQLGEWSLARQFLERALVLQPADAVTLYRMAVLLLQERKPEQSVEITQNLLDTGHTHEAVLFEHARGLAMVGRFEVAEPIFAELVSGEHTFPELPYLYARTLHHLGKVDDAIRFAENYVEKQPEDGIAHGMLSLLYLDNDDLVRAADLSAKALKNAPNNLDALITAGSVALAYENSEEARAHFDKAISLHGDSGRSWAGLGLVNMLGMDLVAARANFERTIELMPTHLGSYNALAWIQLLQRDYAAARKTLEKALDLDRTFGETQGGLAVLAALEGNWDSAKQLSDTAIRLQPDSFSGRYAQSLILTHRGRPERAQEMIELIFKNTDVAAGGSLRDAVQRFMLQQQKQG